MDLYSHAEVAADAADEGRRLREALDPDAHPEGIADWKEAELGLPTRCATAQHAGERRSARRSAGMIGPERRAGEEPY